MLIGIPKELYDGERRVALVPGNVAALQRLGHTVLVERGAGEAASFPDRLYQDAGAELAPDANTVWAKAELVIKVRAPQASETSLMRSGQQLLSLLQPAQNAELLQALSQQQVSALALDAIPRISRAQSMDVLSSMANISGYRAIVEAAHHFGRFFTGQITAAGRIPPAKVLVIGAGVAGLAAIGAAQSLGAIVRAFDTRPAVRDEVRSLGAEFLELNLAEDGTGAGGYAKEMSEAFLKAEMELFAQQAQEVDIIVTTAAIPGKTSPRLITAEMVQSMKPGSVIVDLAAEGGGNCELTEAGRVVQQHGVTIIGKTNLPSELPTQASQLYGNNVVKLLQHLSKDEALMLDQADEITRAITVTHQGQVTWPPPAPEPAPELAPAPEAKTEPEAAVATPAPKSAQWGWLFNKNVAYGIGAVVLLLLGVGGSSEFMSHLFVFMLACFVGYMVVWNVAPSLQTPLMSVTNAISGIIVLGGMLHISGDQWWLSAAAVLIAAVNIVGGFMVTHRMLGMFRK